MLSGFRIIHHIDNSSSVFIICKNSCVKDSIAQSISSGLLRRMLDVYFAWIMGARNESDRCTRMERLAVLVNMFPSMVMWEELPQPIMDEALLIIRSGMRPSGTYALP